MQNNASDEIERFRLRQNWWEIEDCVEPSDARRVICVQDFYIDTINFREDNWILLRLNSFFAEFKVRNKNTGKELSFIREYNNEDLNVAIMVNLGSVSNWPVVRGSEDLHITIEYEYTEILPMFNKRVIYPLGYRTFDITTREYITQSPNSIKERIYLLLIPGYIGQFLMSGPSRGEITITPPKGMHIQDNGENAQIVFYYGGNIGDEGTTTMRLEFVDRPYISDNNDKLRYHHLIDITSYNAVTPIINTRTDQMGYVVTYSVVNDSKFFLMPLFSILIFVLIGVGDLNFSNVFYFAIILLSLTTLYLTLRKEKYQIPFNDLVLISIPVAGILIFIRIYWIEIMNLLL